MYKVFSEIGIGKQEKGGVASTCQLEAARIRLSKMSM